MHVTCFTLLIFIQQQLLPPSLALSDNCTFYESKSKPQFYPLRHCQRSNGTIIGFRNVKSLGDCETFANEKGALAFNFATETRAKRNRFEERTQKETESFSTDDRKRKKHKKLHTISEEYYNCQALACPEYGNFSSMINDTRFDYYSLYTKPPRKLHSQF